MALEQALQLLEATMRLRGFHRRTLKVGDFEVAYHEAGDHDSGPTRMVLIHGLGNSGVVWYKCLGPLARDRRVQAVDLPGFGRSRVPGGRPYATLRQMRDAIIAFLESTGGRAILVGQSLGGWVALKVAIARPDLVERLFLLNNAGILYPQAHELRELLLVTSRDEVRSLWRRIWYRIPWINHLFLNDFLARTDDPVVGDFLESLGPDDFVNDDLPALAVPVTVFWGMADRFIPRSCVDAMVRELTETRVVWIPKCGHIPQLERPKTVVSLLKKYLAQPLVPPPPAHPA